MADQQDDDPEDGGSPERKPVEDQMSLMKYKHKSHTRSHLLKELRALNVTAKELVQEGHKLSALKESGYSLKELRNGGFSLEDLKVRAHVSPPILPLHGAILLVEASLPCVVMRRLRTSPRSSRPQDIHSRS